MIRTDNNLPLQLTGLVGRELEISEVGRLLKEARLLTLTGPGGSGKTRLALAVAFEVVEDHEDGAWLVELASLSEPELVPQALASVLGVREAMGTPLTETLAEHLVSKSTLLVLDNCEHLIDACADLAEALLRRCPGLSILATSREALGITGEAIFVVPPFRFLTPVAFRPRICCSNTKQQGSSWSGRGRSSGTSRLLRATPWRLRGFATASTGYRWP